jgi:hypothetical protein
VLIWIGKEKGVEGLPGIPGRDLTDKEIKKYGGETRLLETGLWIRKEKPKIKSAPSSESP